MIIICLCASDAAKAAHKQKKKNLKNSKYLMMVIRTE